MTTATVLSRAAAGLDAPAVRVEVHLSNGLPGFNIVGLPESTVREARERVRSALLTSHFEWPDHRITVSLAPADLPKGGGRFDLPIALGLLVASGQLPASALNGREFFGELGLDGGVRPCRGLLSAVRAAALSGRLCAVPAGQAETLARMPGARVLAANDLLSLCATLKSPEPSVVTANAPVTAPQFGTDLASINGQAAAKRALEIAASGGHHLMMIGPPGAGKTLLASALPGLLPELDQDDQWQLMLLQDLVGKDASPARPFRAPHHATTAAGLIGGGPRAMPGEVSLAHGGTLFLDELPEFPRRVLDMLRQPLESGEIILSRARCVHRFPARFQLVAAMNPCPCGYAGSEAPPCRCSTDTVRRYQARVSGPLLDRIDLHVALERQDTASLLTPGQGPESSISVRERVERCQSTQLTRQGCLNTSLSGDALVDACRLEANVKQWFERACDTLQLSARSVHRTLKVARTLSDMTEQSAVGEAELLEALGYRPRLGE